MRTLIENTRTYAAYAAAFILLAIVYAVSFDAFATLGQAAYALGHIVAAAAALAAGGAALRRFHAARRDSFLLLSAGLWVAAALHLGHFAAAAGLFGPAGSAGSPLAHAALQRGALLPALFFSLFLGLSLLAGRQNRPSTAQPAGVFMAAGTLAFIATAAALVLPVPPPDGVAWLLGQPVPPLFAQPELLLAAALTVGGIVGLLRGGKWRVEPMARWSLLALIITLAVLARLPLLAVWPSEALLLLAQGLIAASYGCVIIGVIASVITHAAGRATAAAPVAETTRPAPAAAPKASVPAERPAPAPVAAPLDQLQASHRALRNATDGLLLGVRGDGTLTDWKPAADFGPTAMPSDLLGKNLRAALPADQAEAILAAVGRVLHTGETERLQYASTDGSVALGVSITAHSDDEALCVIHDRTAQARALQELEAQRRAMESLRRVMGDWLIRLTRAGTIQDLQPPAALESAMYADMFAGKHLQDLFQGDDVTPLLAAAATALDNGAVQEIAFTRRSGQSLAARVAPCGEDTALCLLRDVTALEEITADLQESEETNQELRGRLERLTAEQATTLEAAELSARALWTLLPDLVLRLRADGTILECKPAESFGPPDAQNSVNAAIADVLPADLAAQIMAAIERARHDGQPQRFTCQPVDGQALAGGVAALASDQFLCVVRDLTQQKQMETALAQQAAVLAREMQAKLEAEHVRSLRAENDALRTRLLDVARVALESGPDGVPADPAEATPAQSEAVSSPQADTSPPQTEHAPPTPSEPPSPPAAVMPKNAAAPDAAPAPAALGNGEPAQPVPATGKDGATPHSAEETAPRAATGVAAPSETPLPHTTANGQREHAPSTNGEPAAKVRPE